MDSRTASIHPLRFGRRVVLHAAPAVPAPVSRISEDVKLFAMTFAAGFLFVSVYIA